MLESMFRLLLVSVTIVGIGLMGSGDLRAHQTRTDYGFAMKWVGSGVATHEINVGFCKGEFSFNVFIGGQWGRTISGSFGKGDRIFAVNGTVERSGHFAEATPNSAYGPGGVFGYYEQENMTAELTARYDSSTDTYIGNWSAIDASNSVESRECHGTFELRRPRSPEQCRVAAQFAELKKVHDWLYTAKMIGPQGSQGAVQIYLNNGGFVRSITHPQFLIRLHLGAGSGLRLEPDQLTVGWWPVYFAHHLDTCLLEVT